MNRADHNAACPCKDCTAYDSAVFMQQYPRATWNVQHYLETERSRELNWNFDPGHCVLCGGTNAASRPSDHYRKPRYNEKLLPTGWFTSLLLHKAGGWVKVYTDLATNPRTTKEKLIEWVCLFLELNPEKCFAIASRETEDWWEIRLGFTELQDETYDQRTKRVGATHRASRGGEKHTDHGASSRAFGSGIQGAASMAG